MDDIHAVIAEAKAMGMRVMFEAAVMATLHEDDSEVAKHLPFMPPEMRLAHYLHHLRACVDCLEDGEPLPAPVQDLITVITTVGGVETYNVGAFALMSRCLLPRAVAQLELLPVGHPRDVLGSRIVWCAAQTKDPELHAHYRHEVWCIRHPEEHELADVTPRARS